MLSYSEALQRIQDIGRAGRLPIERLALGRAGGRVLAEPIVSPIDLPPFDNSAMDGYAIRDVDAQPGRRLPVVATYYAGDPPGPALVDGQCIQVMTGAALPTGCERVIPRENVLAEAQHIELIEVGRAAAHIRHAGEDLPRGQLLLAAGARLGAGKLAALAAAGIDAVNVFRLPRVAVLTTGDELRPPGEPLGPGQIYDSNRFLLQQLLREQGLEPVLWPAVADDRAALAAALRSLTAAFDVIVCSGGVSAGDHDLLPELLATEAELLFWKVRMRPGMPFLLARWDDCLICALPGNPVSVMACYRQLVAPMLAALAGRDDAPPRWPARLLAPLQKSHARTEFVRGKASVDEHGQWQVEPLAARGSHQIWAASQANALIVLPESEMAWTLGQQVLISTWEEPS